MAVTALSIEPCAEMRMTLVSGASCFILPQDVEAVGVAEHQIEQHDVGAGLLEAGPGLGARARRT